MRPAYNHSDLKDIQLSNIYGFLKVLNVYKKNPLIVDRFAIEKFDFFKMVADDSVLDCFIIENILRKSNLQIIFSDKVRIQNYNPYRPYYSRINFLGTFLKNYIITLKLNWIQWPFTRKKVKIFDNSTTVIQLVNNGLTHGDNCILIDGVLKKSFLLNHIVREGKKIIL